MNGLDLLVFTGGIGENQITVRKEICKHLELMGVKLDVERNNVKSEEKEISDSSSKVKIFIIPTDEEMVIARDTLQLVSLK